MTARALDSRRDLSVVVTRANKRETSRNVASVTRRGRKEHTAVADDALRVSSRILVLQAVYEGKVNILDDDDSADEIKEREK